MVVESTPTPTHFDKQHPPWLQEAAKRHNVCPSCLLSELTHPTTLWSRIKNAIVQLLLPTSYEPPPPAFAVGRDLLYGGIS